MYVLHPKEEITTTLDSVILLIVIKVKGKKDRSIKVPKERLGAEAALALQGGVGAPETGHHARWHPSRPTCVGRHEFAQGTVCRGGAPCKVQFARTLRTLCMTPAGRVCEHTWMFTEEDKNKQQSKPKLKGNERKFGLVSKDSADRCCPSVPRLQGNSTKWKQTKAERRRHCRALKAFELFKAHKLIRRSKYCFCFEPPLVTKPPKPANASFWKLVPW